MTTANRFGKRWTINECLQLQREYELLKWSIDAIAEKHQRTPKAIMFKLSEEKLADYNTLHTSYFYKQMKDVPCESSDDESSDDDSSEQVQEYEEEESNVQEDSVADLRTRLTHLEKKMDELTKNITSQQNGSSSKGVRSWFS